MAANGCTFDFTDARVLVTGGTSGIGYAIATAFADAGAAVTITGTRADKAAYADDPVDLDRFEFVQCNTRDHDAIDALIARYESIDVLVNNAGASNAFGDESTPDGFTGTLDANLNGAMRLTFGLHDALAASTLAGGSSVINIISMSAFRSATSVMGYAASKAGLITLTNNLAIRWMDDGIRVNAVAPGLILSRMTAALELPGLEEIKAREFARVPAGRWGTPEECAWSTLFLCTAQSAYTTGTVLAVDGGYLAF
ncbi:MAG: SDR family oxidoreductase [Acidimicrobiia bacterium]